MDQKQFIQNSSNNNLSIINLKMVIRNDSHFLFFGYELQSFLIAIASHSLATFTLFNNRNTDFQQPIEINFI